MQRITNFAEAHVALAKFVPPPGRMLTDYKLDGMLHLMDALGNPQNTYRVIHVAGTSGKTSTSYFSAALLQAVGKKVGLTVSPYIDEVNERVQINLVPLPEAQFCEELTTFLEIVGSTDLEPTYFELLVAFAYWEFARQDVDYAVIEVGLGGLLDGTNVMNRADKVCIITDIGFDHMQILGYDLASIAAQKAGIVLPHNNVFTYVQADEAMGVIRHVSTEKQAELHEVAMSGMDVMSTVPSFQQRNWALARAAYDFIANRDGFSDVSEEILRATQTTYIPARMEIVEYKDKMIIFDGSHNAQKIGVLCDAMRQRFGESEIAVLFGLIEDKESQLKEAIGAITSIAHSIITTPFFPGQDVPRTSLDPEVIATECKSLGFNEVAVADTAEHAVDALLAHPEPVLLVTGSFYLLNTVRPIIRSLIQ